MLIGSPGPSTYSWIPIWRNSPPPRRTTSRELQAVPPPLAAAPVRFAGVEHEPPDAGGHEARCGCSIRASGAIGGAYGRRSKGPPVTPRNSSSRSTQSATGSPTPLLLRGTRDSPAYPRFAAAWCRKQQWRRAPLRSVASVSDWTIIEPVATSPRRGHVQVLLDRAGRRRSRATMPGFHAGRPPRNKGLAIRPILRRWKRSSRSCAPLATIPTAAGCAV